MFGYVTIDLHFYNRKLNICNTTGVFKIFWRKGESLEIN